MNRSIRWRMVTIFVLLVVIVLMVSGTLIVFQTRNYEQNLIEKDIETLANTLLAAISTDQPITEIESDIIQVVSANENRIQGNRVYLLDHQGNIVYTQAASTVEEGFYNAQVMSALAGKDSLDFGEFSPSGEDSNHIGYARSISKNGEVIYVIYITASTKIVDDKISTTVGLIFMAIILAIALSVVLAFLFSNFLTKPISVLSQKARDMAKGELDDPIEVKSNDEIGELTINFNQMAASLKATMFEIGSEKNKMETVITHMTDGILVFDNYGVLSHKNPAAIRMLKLSNVIGYKDVFEPLVHIEYKELLKDIEFTTKKIDLNIGEAYYSVDFAKYMDKEGSVIGVISVVQDITEHKKLEKMQKEFVANVSHELRTPLTTIKSYAEMLLEGVAEDPEISTRFLGVINNESDRMTALVQDLLELSKIDNKKAVLETEVIDLKFLVKKAIDNYRIVAKNSQQELTFEVGDLEYLVLGDVNRINQVLNNLLSNAIKYSGEGAKIHVSIFSNPRYHMIGVSDNGMGIPEEDLDHIFDRFYRVDKARSRAMGGTGLGLAIAKEIMELHKGKIEVKSKVNVGTTFTILLPVFKEDTESDFDEIQ